MTLLTRAATIFMLLSFASPVPAQVSDAQLFVSHGPYRGSVPSPMKLLGYAPGFTHTTYYDQERVIMAIASAAKDRVRVMEYGRSVEGRPLRLIAVSAPENIAKLDAIRERIQKLADPRKIGSTIEENQLVTGTPNITWINHCIHGDETASFEAAMWTLYALAASESADITRALKDSVVILNPVYNPDGHERYVTYYNSVAMGSSERWSFEHDQPWGIYGRYNHFRFDLNRDKLAQTQEETRQESVAHLKWMPQVYVDQHGETDPYFFPPNAKSVNSNVDRTRLEKWTTIIGKGNAAAFDKYGWPYMTRETFDFFFQGYLDTWATLNGAIGMTYETDGGKQLASKRRDQTVSTLRDGIAHHHESAIATILTAAMNREQLLRDFLAYRRKAVEDGKKGPMRRVVLLPGSDPGRLAEAAASLRRQGIEVGEALTAFKSEKAHNYLAADAAVAKTQEFPVGSLVIDLAQPQGHLAKAILEPDADYEPDFVKEQYARRERNEKRNEHEAKEGYGFYDITAWSLPFTYSLEAYWTEDAAAVQTEPVKLMDKGEISFKSFPAAVALERSPVGYAFRYDGDAAGVLAARLLADGFRLAVANKPFKADGVSWPTGSFIMRVSRNPANLYDRLKSLAQELGVNVKALKSAYSDESEVGIHSESIRDLVSPRIAVLAGDPTDQSSYGALWYILQNVAKLPFSAIKADSLGSVDLSRFTAIVVPDGYGYTDSIGKGGIAKLKEWINRGGALIGLGGGGQWMIEKDAGISTAHKVGEDDKPDAKPDAPKPDDKPDADDKKPKKPVSLPGGIFRATLDKDHYLAYGYEGSELPVPVAGDVFLKPSKDGSNPVKFGASGLRLSGFIWPKNTEDLLANTSWAIDEPMGRGHAIIFLHDPVFRAYWTGLRKMLLNAIIMAPGRAAVE